MKGIYFSNNSYGIRWWDKEQKKYIHGGRFATREEAEIELTRRMGNQPTPTIRGVDMVQYDADYADSLWKAAGSVHKVVRKAAEERRHTAIHLGDQPVALAFLSDLHIGSEGTDYDAIKRDTDLISKTDGMYAVFHGDGIDNWIIGKLQALQRNQAVSFKNEILMFRRWLELISEKLLIVVSGNHDNWTKKLSGIDIIPNYLTNTCVLYDPFEVRVQVSCGTGSWDMLIRHQWKSSSIFNPTHGIEVGYDRMTLPFDIGVGGHTHIGTLVRPFYRHNKERLAILTGAYKRVDSFSKEIGFADTMTNGCGALILFPDGKVWYNSDLEVAASYLTYLRRQQW
jgi:UDP-2,3-diacylglucosamine pyrophosphatase LpxH